MFSSITWELYFTTVVIILGGYYGITTLLLYHREVVQWVKTRGKQQPIVTNAPAKQSPVSSVMGGVQTEPTQTLRSSVATAADLNVAESDEEPDTVYSPEASSSEEHLLIGNIADLLQEIKTVSQLMTECKSDKAEGESLFRTLLLRYSHLRNTTYRDAINLFIAEVTRNQFVFDLSITEINAWWDDEQTSKQ